MSRTKSAVAVAAAAMRGADPPFSWEDGPLVLEDDEGPSDIVLVLILDEYIATAEFVKASGPGVVSRIIVVVRVDISVAPF